MAIDPHIFRAYDIRGKAYTQLTAEACWWIATAFGSVVREKYAAETKTPTVVVGHDARTHSPEFLEEVVSGLMAAGCSVKRIGQTPSPLNYFTVCNRGFDAGIQITASHNPKEDNGLKLHLRGAEAYAGEDLQTLRQRIEAKQVLSGTGAAEDVEAVMTYMEYLEQLFPAAGARRHVVVDGGNGVAGPTYAMGLKRIKAKVTGIYLQPDGTFPNHPADPSKYATLADLQAKVLETGADCGFAFDGDGDRLGVIDEKGQIVTADQIILLLAKDHLSRNPGAPVVFTVSNSGLLESEITKWGGRPVMCKVGHSFVEHAMRDNNAQLGGEQSGHFFCGEGYYGFDDALVAAMRVLSILGANKKAKLSELIAEFPPVFQAHELRPHCDDAKKKEIVAKISEYFAAKYPVNTLDGARVDFGDGAWAGIRYSNTSPCLSVCIEARSPEKLKAVEAEVLGHLGTYAEVQL
ncbi:MAG TPA: phosphomannomutase/phosphoglucomutase [Candidatus Peribacteria bacterium]|nr:phosphomannomutase/phosphoglucomutase [Candidatus Peribacteria bacterium]